MDKAVEIRCSIYTQIKPQINFIKDGPKKTLLKICRGCHTKVYFTLLNASTIAYYYRLLNVKLLLSQILLLVVIL